MDTPHHHPVTIVGVTVDFYDFTESRSAGAFDDVIDELLPYLRRIPAAHWRAISGARVYVVKALARGRAYGGGGFYPPSDIPNWHGRERSTGVADSWLVPADMPLGLVAVKNSKVNDGIRKYRYTFLHELLHMIADELDLARGVTLEQLRGMSYGRVIDGEWRERPSVGEYLAEAYSRYLIQADTICRQARTVQSEDGPVAVPSTMPETGENAVGECSARLRRELSWLFAGDNPPARSVTR